MFRRLSSGVFVHHSLLASSVRGLFHVRACHAGMVGRVPTRVKTTDAPVLQILQVCRARIESTVTAHPA